MAIPRLRTEDGNSYCSNCNTEVEGMAGACSACGKEFDEDRDAVRCVSCGVANLPGSISCLKCGKLLKANASEKAESKDVESNPEAPTRPPDSTGPDEEGEPSEEETRERAAIEEVKKRTQSLWELSEPFEKVIKSRRRRLAKINYLLERTKEKLKELEKIEAPEDHDERVKLKRQIDEIMSEKEEIVNIEEGIAEMERIYRNLLALQETELKKKQESLQARLQSFEERIEKWTKERDGLKTKEDDLKSRESEIQRKIREIEQREKSLVDREKQLKDKMRELRKEELDIMKMKFTGDSSSLVTKKGYMGQGDGTQAEVRQVNTEAIAKEQEEMNRRMAELEEEAKKASTEREKLKALNDEIVRDQKDVKMILKVLDDLLVKLPESEIKKFADSEDFKLYEKVLDKFEL